MIEVCSVQDQAYETRARPAMLGYIWGNADLLAIRLRERIRGRGCTVQLWIGDDGELIYARNHALAARRVNDPVLIVGTYTSNDKATDISADISVTRDEYAARGKA